MLLPPLQPAKRRFTGYLKNDVKRPANFESFEARIFVLGKRQMRHNFSPSKNDHLCLPHEVSSKDEPRELIGNSFTLIVWFAAILGNSENSSDPFVKHNLKSALLTGIP